MKTVIITLFCFNFLQLHAQSWDEVIKIVASDRAAGDAYGTSVAISGNYAVVGSPYERHDLAGANEFEEAGAAYIFEMDGNGDWIQKQKIVASERGIYRSFGQSVAISGDYIVVGAVGSNSDASGANPLGNAGAAYVFKRNGAGVWEQHQKLVASDREVGDYFGNSVAISNTYIIVGAWFEDHNVSGTGNLPNAGSAYIFEMDGNGDWIQKQKIIASDRVSNDRFGLSVGISGNYAVVGTRFDNKGENGSASLLTQAGSAYIFERDGVGTWTQVQKIVASDRVADAFFGVSVSISGNYIAIGASSEKRDASGGSSFDYAGAVYVFERGSGGTWSQQQKIVASDRGTGDNFGSSVSVDGVKIVVGAHFEEQDATGSGTLTGAGSAYIFEYKGGVWLQSQKIVASDRGAEDEFGFSVAVSGDYVIVGAPKEDHNISGGALQEDAGSAYIFKFENNVSVSTINYEAGISVYPNPNNGKFVIDMPVDSKLKIMDLTGRVISETSISKGKNVIELNEKTGVYLLSFNSDKGQETKRVTVR
jgi:hypothetical protein